MELIERLWQQWTETMETRRSGPIGSMYVTLARCLPHLCLSLVCSLINQEVWLWQQCKLPMWSSWRTLMLLVWPMTKFSTSQSVGLIPSWQHWLHDFGNDASRHSAPYNKLLCDQMSLAWPLARLNLVFSFVMCWVVWCDLGDTASCLDLTMQSKLGKAHKDSTLAICPHTWWQR